MKRFFLAFAIMVFSNIAYGAYYDGNKLLADCTSPTSKACTNYIIGIIDGIEMTQDLAEDNPNGVYYCFFNSDLTKEGVMRIVREYLIENRKVQNYSAASIVIMALRESGNCQEKE